MDARKIRFLLAMQQEIDKLEKLEGQTKRVEALKGRFYRVIDMGEIAAGKPVEIEGSATVQAKKVREVNVSDGNETLPRDLQPKATVAQPPNQLPAPNQQVAQPVDVQGKYVKLEEGDKFRLDIFFKNAPEQNRTLLGTYANKKLIYESQVGKPEMTEGTKNLIRDYLDSSNVILVERGGFAIGFDLFSFKLYNLSQQVAAPAAVLPIGESVPIAGQLSTVLIEEDFLPTGKEATNGKDKTGGAESDKNLAEKKAALHNPKAVRDKLRYFASSETFKHFTHAVPKGDFDYDEIMKNAAAEWKNFSPMYNFNERTYYRLYDFCVRTSRKDAEKDNTKRYGGNEFGFWTDEYVIPISWASPEVAAWCADHPGDYPGAMRMPKEKRNPDKQNKRLAYGYFNEVINRFKHDIEQRDDDPRQTLDQLVRKCLSDVDTSNDLKITMDDLALKNATFYADLVQFKSALRQIFKWILVRKSESNGISVQLKHDSGKCELEVFHVDARVPSDKADEKLNGTGGDTATVRKLLRSVCDWHVTYSFKGESGQYSSCFKYLTDGCDIGEPVRGEKTDDFANGTLHKLIFYK